jgi:hypothetical protein
VTREDELMRLIYYPTAAKFLRRAVHLEVLLTAGASRLESRESQESDAPARRHVD